MKSPLGDEESSLRRGYPLLSRDAMGWADMASLTWVWVWVWVWVRETNRWIVFIGYREGKAWSRPNIR